MGWTTLAINPLWAQDLGKAAGERQKKRQFHTAALARTSNLEIRNDETFWLDAKLADLELIEHEALSGLESLKQQLRDFFRIHIAEIECHYSYYEPGHFYLRHQDATGVNNQRIFSFVIYLNVDWQPKDQGQLIGYHQDEILFSILPKMGTMIIFRSEIEHEVRPGNRNRWALTGWFRK